MAKFNLFNFLERKFSTAEMETITAKMAERLSFKELAVYIAVSYIANTLSKCEFRTYEDGKEVHDKLYYILNVSPNPNQNSSQFINKFIEQYFYTGHSLLVPNGEYLYCADSFDVDDTNPLKENTFYNVSFNSHQMRKKYKANEVFYMKLDNANAKALIDGLYLEYGKLIEVAIQAFKKSNGQKYKLIMDQYKAGDPNFNKMYEGNIKAQLKTFLENENAVYPQFKGFDLQDISGATTGNTSDIVAMRKEIFETTAQAFKVPLSMMYGNITNMNEIVKVYLSICIDPLADMISEELTRKYYTFDEWKAGNKVVVDTSCINHVDILEVANELYNALGSGIPNIDDLRRRLGMEALNTPFTQQHFLSKNFVPIEDVLVGTTEGGENE